MKRLRFMIPVLMIVAAAAMMTVSPALAAKGGRHTSGGGGGGGGTTYSGTCAVTPVPVPLGTQFTLTGTGFVPYQSLTLTSAYGPSYVFADGSGKFSVKGVTPSTGTFSFTITDYSSGAYITSCSYQVV